MLKNYLKIAIRTILKQKSYSLINIAGLTLGMMVCILILLYVQYELSFDRHHVHKDRIYRIERIHLQWSDGSVALRRATLAPSFIPLLEDDFPQIEHAVRIFDAGEGMVSYEHRRFVENHIFFAEHDIFEVFTIPLIHGDPERALESPNNMVISQSMAEKYFGQDDAMGKQLLVDDRLLFNVTGVMEDTPQNSHIHFDFLASYITLKGFYGEGENDYFWGSTNFSDNVVLVYARLSESTDIDGITARIPEFLDRRLQSWQNEQGITVLPSQSDGLGFRKVPDIHLHSRTTNEVESNSDIRYVRLFAIIALFILLIACINFMNLSTARAIKRAREVGLRKVVGAYRRMLVFQFLGESFLIALCAMVLALVLVMLVLPFFSAFCGHDLGLRLADPLQVLRIVVVFLFTGLAAGLYPAFYLSVFQPSAILRGEITRGIRGAVFRKVLVVFQFAISVVLIIGVGVVYGQMDFLRNTDLGYQRENILMFPADAVLKQNWRSVKPALARHPSILSVTMSKRAPTGGLHDAPGFAIEINGEALNNPFHMPHNRVEHDFFRTYGMQIVAGRDFSLAHPTDSTEAFILNQMAVRSLGLENPDDVVGEPVEVSGGRKGRVIGVVRDFHYESLRRQIVPIITYISLRGANTIAVRLAPGNPKEKIDHIQSVIDQYHPGFPLNYTFLDERIDALYRNEARMMEMFGYFSMLAIFIACLGLFGLTSFTAERKTKEIGIRKVLGASVPGITLVLSKEFTKWVLLANLIAWPVAFYAMNRWLQGFAYRDELNVWTFVLSAILSLLIALLTVSYQSVRAALANPVDALKYE